MRRTPKVEPKFFRMHASGATCRKASVKQLRIICAAGFAVRSAVLLIGVSGFAAGQRPAKMVRFGAVLDCSNK